jgi:hypothetical protein
MEGLVLDVKSKEAPNAYMKDWRRRILSKKNKERCRS